MTEEELLRIQEIIRQQTTLIQRLKSELRMARGAVEETDPLEGALAIALAAEVAANVRIEAASLVLQHAAAEGQVATATAVLSELARRDDVPGDDRVDALKALARRQVPKVTPTSVVDAGLIGLAERLKAARLAAYEQQASNKAEEPQQ